MWTSNLIPPGSNSHHLGLWILSLPPSNRERKNHLYTGLTLSRNWKESQFFRVGAQRVMVGRSAGHFPSFLTESGLWYGGWPLQHWRVWVFSAHSPAIQANDTVPNKGDTDTHLTRPRKHMQERPKPLLEKKRLAFLQLPDKWAIKVTKLRAWSESFQPGKCSRQPFLITYESNP